jgi:hypothetical protein
MKKLSILLIGLLLVTGFAFAQEWSPSISVSGSATLTWGVNLNDPMITGFQNDESASLSIELIASGDLTNGGSDDGLSGSITIAGVGYSEGGTPAAGDVTAKIVISPIEIIIANAPSMSFGNVTILDIDGPGVATSIVGANTIGGVTIVIPVDPVTVDVFLVSDGDWTDNANNDYATGLTATIDVSPLTLDVGVLYGWFEGAKIALTANVGVSVAEVVNGLDANVGFDMEVPDVGDAAWEVGADVTLNFSEANADDDQANVSLGVSYAELDDLDAELGFSEPTAGGVVDAVGASIAVGLNDITGDVEDLSFDIAVDIDYSAGGLSPYAGFTYRSSDDLITAKAGVGLGSDLTGIDLTTIDIDWASTDLTEDGGAAGSDLGILTIAFTVSY